MFTCERAITKKSLLKAVYDPFLMGIHAWTHYSCEVVLAGVRAVMGKKEPKLDTELRNGGNKKDGVIENIKRALKVVTRPEVIFDVQSGNCDRRRQRLNRKSLQTAADAATEALHALDLSDGDQKKVNEFIAKVNQKLDGKSFAVQGAIIVDELQETSNRSKLL